ncbi:SMI1/KNR4 family protein [Spirillospora sp. CA-294931]|uniref:SMI1/KNR4 family protein n=1 Tax=Spirillospora sp. CA-294931 TaxID=3240042 RepID=UPI003D91681C
MKRYEWRPFLKRWSQDWIAAHDPERDRPLDEDVVRNEWLGFSPATSAQVAEAEARLGLTLPPSFRDFLLTTDGWRDAGNFVYRLAGTAEIGYLRDMDSMWNVYADADDDLGPDFNAVVQISLEGDACVLFLDPGDMGGDGEWAAYRLASWSGMGPERHASFHDLMHALFSSFHALRKPPGETRREWDAEVETARVAALSGEVDGPLQVFEEAAKFGHARAQLLAFQMRALGWDARHLALPAGEDAWLLDDPAFTGELLPLIVAREPHASQTLMRSGPERVRLLIARYAERLGDSGYRMCFGDPGFDAAVNAVVDRLSTDPGADVWPDLREAVGLWRPLSDHHLAPVILLAHPALSRVITGARGREILSMPRSGR